MRTHPLWANSGLILSLVLCTSLESSALSQTSQPSPTSPAKVEESGLKEATTEENRASVKREKSDEDGEKGGEFVRVMRDEKGRPQSLDTAIVRYVPSTKAENGDSEKSVGVVVDLIGAIHVGEAGYYEDLNERFAKYDALLFELVAPEGIQFREGEKLESSSPVGALQGGLKSLLGLEFQLELVNYARPNFVHADMTPEEFSQTMKDRGESFLQMLFRMMGHGMAVQGQQKGGGATDIQVLMALLRRDRVVLKRLMAEQLEGMEGSLSVLGGPDGGSTIITERNKKALEVLRRELDAGKKKIGIFYGAGHLSDFDTRLKNDFQLELVEKTWLPAWDLKTDHSLKNNRRQ